MEVCVSNRGVCSCHSLQQCASIDFFGAYLIHSLHISPSLSLSLNYNNIHGWLAARVNWGKKNLNFPCAAVHSGIYSTHSMDGWRAVFYNYAPGGILATG